MAKVTVIIESDRMEEDELREQVQGWIQNAYDLDPDQFRMRIVKESYTQRREEMSDQEEGVKP